MQECPHALSHPGPLVAPGKQSFEVVPGMIMGVTSEVRHLDLNLSLTPIKRVILGGSYNFFESQELPLQMRIE